MAFRASCHVRLEMPESVPARYALAIWRFSCGWRMDSLRALSSDVASARFLVPVLSCFTGFGVFDVKHAATLATVEDVTTFHKFRLFVRSL
jgi:hypothetical protein